MMLDKYSDETDFFDDIYIKSAEIDFYAYVDKMTKKDERNALTLFKNFLSRIVYIICSR